jgi:glycine cleavage system regulatory protein
MDAPLVITAVAPDRPGLVESLAAAVARHHGNWLESRMARLGGQFAGILRCTIPHDQREKLLADLESLEASGLTLIIQTDQPASAVPDGRIVFLTLVGQDRPGIVRQISQVFARSDVNVEELETECSSAPMSGETLFHARARLRVPSACPTQALRSELEKIASDLMVDVNLTEISPTET